MPDNLATRIRELLPHAIREQLYCDFDRPGPGGQVMHHNSIRTLSHPSRHVLSTPAYDRVQVPRKKYLATVDLMCLLFNHAEKIVEALDHADATPA